jgi:hypothetical protein
MAHDERPTSVAEPAEDLIGDETAREQRLRVLHQLAQRATPLARPASSLGAKPIRLTREEVWRIADRRAARRKRLAQGIGVTLVLLVLAVALRPAISLPSFALPSLSGGAPRRAVTPQLSGPLIIDLARDGIGCPSDTAWSQQRPSVAVIGNPSCTQSPGFTNPVRLNIYDATTGRLLQQLSLDDTVLPALHQASGSSNQIVFYQHLLWSLQGTLAATFFAQVTDSSASSPFYAGLVLVNPDGGTPQVFVQHMPDQVFAYHLLWDLANGKASVLKNAVAGDRYSPDSLPPALGYHWGDRGQFVVDRPLPPNPADPTAMLEASREPIGDPVASLVSIWQPGEVTFQQIRSGAPFTAEWMTDFVGWSPDGGYLLDAVTLQALLQPPGQPLIDTSTFGDSPPPILPIRDAGMQTLISTLQSVSTTLNVTRSALVAWRPDGAVLAAQPGQTLAGAPANAIMLLDCVSGKTLATLRIPSHIRASGVSGNASQLRWSPDGTRLLLYDPVLDVLVVWGASALPG